MVDDTLAFCHDRRTRVACHNFFHAGTNEWCLGLQQWHGLTHHVGAHQRAVRIVILKEWDQRGGDRDQLLW